MDIAAMADRCPASKAIGPARLMNHRFFIMQAGYASVRRAPGSVVHGLLWDLALADVPTLDAFEGGDYAKIVRPVMRAIGAVRALIYVGRTMAEGKPRPGYIDNIVASAEALALPADYRRGLTQILRGGTRGAPFVNGAEPAAEGPVPGVRARFATPFDRDQGRSIDAASTSTVGPKIAAKA